MPTLNILDTVANLEPIPADRLTLVEQDYELVQSLPVGQVGTVLEVYDGDTPHCLVEFADLQGREYAMATLNSSEVLVLHYELAMAA
ncbi:MAG: DUF4926 domain-containing protein [Cyanobacteria bacterium J06621_11]